MDVTKKAELQEKMLIVSEHVDTARGYPGMAPLKAAVEVLTEVVGELVEAADVDTLERAEAVDVDTLERAEAVSGAAS